MERIKVNVEQSKSRRIKKMSLGREKPTRTKEKPQQNRKRRQTKTMISMAEFNISSVTGEITSTADFTLILLALAFRVYFRSAHLIASSAYVRRLFLSISLLPHQNIPFCVVNQRKSAIHITLCLLSSCISLTIHFCLSNANACVCGEAGIRRNATKSLSVCTELWLVLFIRLRRKCVYNLTTGKQLQYQLLPSEAVTVTENLFVFRHFTLSWEFDCVQVVRIEKKNRRKQNARCNGAFEHLCARSSANGIYAKANEKADKSATKCDCKCHAL